MLEIIEGFKKERMPFNQVKSLEYAWESASFALKNNISQKYKLDFEKKYSTTHSAFELLSKRFTFYMKILKGNEDVMEKFEETLGKNLLEERTFFAMYKSYEMSERLLDEMNHQIHEFSNYCFKKENYKQSKIYVNYCNDCDKTGICVCLGKEEPYTKGCIDDLSLIMLDYETTKCNNKNKFGDFLKHSEFIFEGDFL